MTRPVSDRVVRKKRKVFEGDKRQSAYPIRQVDGVWQRNVNGRWQSLKITVTDPTKLKGQSGRNQRLKPGEAATPLRVNVWSWS